MEDRPVDRAEALRLGRAARELWLKVGTEVRHVRADGPPVSEGELAAYLVHEDGWMRVPVLVDGPLLVRGYTEALYTHALGGAPHDR